MPAPQHLFITAKGVRALARLSGDDPEAAVKAWRDEWRDWLRAEKRAKRQRGLILRVTSGETILKPKDAESLRHTTEGPPPDKKD